MYNGNDIRTKNVVLERRDSREGWRKISSNNNNNNKIYNISLTYVKIFIIFISLLLIIKIFQIL